LNPYLAETAKIGQSRMGRTDVFIEVGVWILPVNSVYMVIIIMNKIPHFYTHNAGIGPSVRNGILVQAICIKNKRSNAEEGDWIFGISGTMFLG
jgi:hypothetical protein